MQDRGNTKPKSLPNPAPIPEGWPKGMNDEAFHGPLGELVRVIEPNTEADPHGLLLDVLTSFGSAVGKGTFFQVEADRNHLNLFSALAGQSGVARKGTALGHTQRFREHLDEHWAKNRVQSGLSSGEGLTKAAEAAQNGNGNYGLLLVEDELASVLKAMSRRGNTLSTTLRRAWDGRTLQVLTKAEPQLVMGAHISVVANITVADLHRYLSHEDLINGFANRFLWGCVHRVKLLPFGGEVPEEELLRLMDTLRDRLEFARKVGEIGMSAQAKQLWIAEYPDLTAEVPGLFGSVVSRGDAQVRRLAAVYAVADKSHMVRPPDLRAALEVWRYCRDSAEYLFKARHSGKQPKAPTDIKTRVMELLKGSPKV